MDGADVLMEEMDFNRRHSKEDGVRIDVYHENGDAEGFSIPFDAVKPLLRALRRTSYHSVIKGLP